MKKIVIGLIAAISFSSAYYIQENISVFYNKITVSKENVQMAENVIRRFASCVGFANFNYGTYNFNDTKSVIFNDKDLIIKLSGEPKTPAKDIATFLRTKEILKSNKIVFDINQTFNAPENILRKDKTVIFGKEVFEQLELFNFYLSNKQCSLKTFKYNIQTKLELSPKYQAGYIVNMHYIIECKKKKE